MKTKTKTSNDMGALSMAGEAMPANGDRLLMLLDGPSESQLLYEVITGTPHVLPGGGGNSHAEMFLRRLPLAPGVSI